MTAAAVVVLAFIVLLVIYVALVATMAGTAMVII